MNKYIKNKRGLIITSLIFLEKILTDLLDERVKVQLIIHILVYQIETSCNASSDRKMNNTILLVNVQTIQKYKNENLFCFIGWNHKMWVHGECITNGV